MIIEIGELDRGNAWWMPDGITSQATHAVLVCPVNMLRTRVQNWGEGATGYPWFTGKMAIKMVQVYKQKLG